MDQYIGKMLDNRYEILELIGSGGMANVYKAKCHRLNRMVAVKILKNDLAENADFRRRFRDESLAVAQLSHANIVSVYDVSNTHVSYLISEAFKYSHIVLASVTYNLGIYPVMKNFLEDMKALNLQNRTFALIENGSWACKSGDLMQAFIDEELKNMTVLNERLSLASSLQADKAAELDQLADALVESLQEDLEN